VSYSLEGRGSGAPDGLRDAASFIFRRLDACYPNEMPAPATRLPIENYRDGQG
jgi:hypothetical protein